MKQEQFTRLESIQPKEVSSQRPRRLRKNPAFRSLVSETQIDKDHLVMPLFVQEGNGIRERIESMPGIYRYSPDRELDKEIQELSDLGINSVLLFGIPKSKDSIASESYNPNGVVQQATRRIREVAKEMVVISDVCMCEYTDHGHCGIVSQNGILENDKTLPYLGKIAVSQAAAGSDIVAPSSMTDNQVMVIRTALDSNGFESVPIMSYSAKFASAFYGPFREAADSTPQFGDRETYQMDRRNIREALKETQIDVVQGADIIMVKPALAYLDVIRAMRRHFVQPLAAYSVSGEYSMLKAAAINGWIDEDRMVDEILYAIRRAGADIIITYFAKQFASRNRSA